VEYHCDNLLERLHLLTLHNRFLHFDALFLINILPGVECCLSTLETASIWNTRNFNMFTCSSASAKLQLDVDLLQVQFVNLQVFLGALVWLLVFNSVYFAVSCVFHIKSDVYCFMLPQFLITTVLKAITCSCFLKMTIALLFVVSLPLCLRL
jgi:hypothetical protein